MRFCKRRLSFMQMFFFAFVLAAGAGVQALADQPSLDETVDYINEHIHKTTIEVDGHTLKVRWRGTVLRADILNLCASCTSSRSGETRMEVEVDCSHNNFCITDQDNDHHGAFGLGCENDPICPRVANAVAHLITLVQKGYAPEEDPFAKPIK
jgi:hypothetical protein